MCVVPCVIPWILQGKQQHWCCGLWASDQRVSQLLLMGLCRFHKNPSLWVKLKKSHMLNEKRYFGKPGGVFWWKGGGPVH